MYTIQNLHAHLVTVSKKSAATYSDLSQIKAIVAWLCDDDHPKLSYEHHEQLKTLFTDTVAKELTSLYAPAATNEVELYTLAMPRAIKRIASNLLAWVETMVSA